MSTLGVKAFAHEYNGPDQFAVSANDVRIGEAITVHDVLLKTTKAGGYAVQMPQYERDGEYRDLCYAKSAQLREAILDACVQAHEAENHYGFVGGRTNPFVKVDVNPLDGAGRLKAIASAQLGIAYKDNEGNISFDPQFKIKRIMVAEISKDDKTFNVVDNPGRLYVDREGYTRHYDQISFNREPMKDMNGKEIVGEEGRVDSYAKRIPRLVMAEYNAKMKEKENDLDTRIEKAKHHVQGDAEPEVPAPAPEK